ncbi:MAG: hypothetical protein K2Q01_05280, partial [Rickettsiales bacterium]|nr:hypothetical protein [Rickettsiales bacterium]
VGTVGRNSNPSRHQPFTSTHMVDISDRNTAYRGRIILHGDHDPATNKMVLKGYELRPEGMDATKAGRYVPLTHTAPLDLNDRNAGLDMVFTSVAREKDVPFTPLASAAGVPGSQPTLYMPESVQAQLAGMNIPFLEVADQMGLPVMPRTPAFNTNNQPRATVAA